jgi:hypothetical protein
MNVIIWSSGEKFNKTKREDKPILNDKNEIINNIPLRSETTRRGDKINPEKYQQFIDDRPMLAQTCQNPFFSKDFKDVINDQEKFLIPKDSFNEKA